MTKKKTENPPDLLVLVETEIERRLQAGNVEDVPNHVIFKFYTDSSRQRERREKDAQEEESTPFRLLDVLGTFPTDKAIELLVLEVQRLSSDLADHEMALDELRRNHARKEMETEPKAAEPVRSAA